MAEDVVDPPDAVRMSTKNSGNDRRTKARRVDIGVVIAVNNSLTLSDCISASVIERHLLSAGSHLFCTRMRDWYKSRATNV